MTTANLPRETVQLLLPRMDETAPVMVQFAPGQRAAMPPTNVVPKYGVVQWQPAGDGTYKPVVLRIEAWISVPDAERMFGLPDKSVYRLIKGEFVVHDKPTPRSFRVQLDSLMAHLLACRDPEFWTPARIQRWSETL